MNAWLIDQLDGLKGLHLAEVPAPVPAANEVVLAVEYAALNPADRYLAERQYPARPPLPHVLGRDGVGRVIRVGDGVRDVEVGQRRLIIRCQVGVECWGTFAQEVAVPADSLAQVPVIWSMREAAGAALVYLTAYQAITAWADLKPPGLVLVSGASGGVGLAALQLALAMGYQVITLSRSPEKRQQLRHMGAVMVLNPEDAGWRKEAKALAGSAGVSLAIDNIGGELLPQMIDTLGENGRVSLVGRLAGPVPQFNTAALFFRRIRMMGIAVGAYDASQTRAAWKQILQLLEGKGFKPVVDKVFPFDQLPAAFARLAQGPMGKVVLSVGDGQ